MKNIQHDKSVDEVIEEQLGRCKTLLYNKNGEYATADYFHNFRVAAELQGITMRQALAGFMAKHTVSIYDMCDGGEYSLEKWDEKITDHINYLLILRAMVELENE